MARRIIAAVVAWIVVELPQSVEGLSLSCLRRIRKRRDRLLTVRLTYFSYIAPIDGLRLPALRASLTGPVPSTDVELPASRATTSSERCTGIFACISDGDGHRREALPSGSSPTDDSCCNPVVRSGAVHCDQGQNILIGIIRSTHFCPRVTPPPIT